MMTLWQQIARNTSIQVMDMVILDGESEEGERNGNKLVSGAKNGDQVTIPLLLMSTNTQIGTVLEMEQNDTTQDAQIETEHIEEIVRGGGDDIRSDEPVVNKVPKNEGSVIKQGILSEPQQDGKSKEEDGRIAEDFQGSLDVLWQGIETLLGEEDCVGGVVNVQIAKCGVVHDVMLSPRDEGGKDENLDGTTKKDIVVEEGVGANRKEGAVGAVVEDDEPANLEEAIENHCHQWHSGPEPKTYRMGKNGVENGFRSRRPRCLGVFLHVISHRNQINFTKIWKRLFCKSRAGALHFS